MEEKPSDSIIHEKWFLGCLGQVTKSLDISSFNLRNDETSSDKNKTASF